MPLGPPFVRTLGQPGRRLTSDEVEEEVRNIETRPWPHGTVLPVKNLYDDRVGCIFRGPDFIESEVTIPDRGAKPEKYPTLKAMVEAGWVGD